MLENIANHGLKVCFDEFHPVAGSLLKANLTVSSSEMKYIKHGQLQFHSEKTRSLSAQWAFSTNVHRFCRLFSNHCLHGAGILQGQQPREVKIHWFPTKPSIFQCEKLRSIKIYHCFMIHSYIKHIESTSCVTCAMCVFMQYIT